MCFTDDTLLAENQNPLITTAARWGPMWKPIAERSRGRYAFRRHVNEDNES